jgi:hypothetical protein
MSGVNADGYTADQQQQLDFAKRKHRETTDSAQRALQTANQTRQLAADTLEELHTQGEKLEKVDRDLNDIDTDVKEAKGILRYMRRCCLCFLCSCCCDCDPDAERDNQRRKRVKARDQARRSEHEMSQMDRQRRREQMNGQVNGAAKQELLQGAQPRQRPGDRMARQMGEGLADKDRDDIQHQTELQERALDGIDSALDDLGVMSKHMGVELDEQNRRVDAVGARAENTHDEIRNIQRNARQDFKLRVR